METKLIVSMVTVLVAFIVMIVFLTLENEKNNEKYRIGTYISAFVLLGSLLYGGVIDTKMHKYDPVEYPAERYEIGYKTVNVDGQVDTVYLVRRKKN